MLMYHKDSKQPVDVHLSQVETMKNRGWTEKSPVLKPITPTKEAKDNG